MAHSARGANTPPTTEPAAEWAASTPDKWPQLVLTNQASFEGHTALDGASSFLVRMPDDEVMVGTAKHLIKEPGGVNPPVLLEDLDHELKTWQVFPRTKPELAINAIGLGETSHGEVGHDWLLLHLSDPQAKLPAVPLVPRAEPVAIGETVYLVGVPYSDKDSAQNVYKGVVTARPFRHFFKYQFSLRFTSPGSAGRRSSTRTAFWSAMVFHVLS